MRLVVKAGTSTLTYSTGKANFKFIDGLCRTLSDLKNAGNEVILVSSGAIARGVEKLAFSSKPADIPTKQAAAAIGQCELMYTYDRFFSDYGQTVAQILITADDVSDEKRRSNFHNTLIRLLELGIIPVINENDTIATKEISLGDNDSLAAIVAVSVQADILVVLTDTDGLYTGNPKTDPKAKLIPEVKEITEEMQLAAGGAGALGTGGMSTKLQAAKLCMEHGLDMVIANGSTADIIYKAVQGEAAGTKFIGRRR